MTLIDEAVTAGARRHKACEVLGITGRTLRRWRAAKSLADGRKGAIRACPHALSDEEKEQIVTVCNSPEYKSLPPSQIVPRLADHGVYLASESSFYRVLREHAQANRRGRAEAPRVVAKPKAWAATAPNQVWSWDIWADNTPVALLTTSGQALSVADRIFANGFEPAAAIATTLRYIHSDQLDSPRAVTSTSGTLLWNWAWQTNPFGETQPSGSISLNLRFPGQFLDVESDLAYNYYRDYEPQTGRYVESNPIGLIGGNGDLRLHWELTSDRGRCLRRVIPFSGTKARLQAMRLLRQDVRTDTVLLLPSRGANMPGKKPAGQLLALGK